MKHHPDRNPGDEEAVVKFKEAAEAFEVLSHPEKAGSLRSFRPRRVGRGRGAAVPRRFGHFRRVRRHFQRRDVRRPVRQSPRRGTRGGRHPLRGLARFGGGRRGRNEDRPVPTARRMRDLLRLGSQAGHTARAVPLLAAAAEAWCNRPASSRCKRPARPVTARGRRSATRAFNAAGRATCRKW